MKYKFILFFFLAVFCINCQERRCFRETNPCVLLKNLQKSFLDKKGNKHYPPYYGGAYIENSSLIVIVIGDTLRSKKDLIRRCNGNNFVMHFCHEKQDAIRKILHHLYIFRKNKENDSIINELQFRASYMNSNKRISIELLSFQENRFRNLVIDSPFLDFERQILIFE
jgi:hypothetical protein